jgi:flagellar basal-body rod protein FlgC
MGQNGRMNSALNIALSGLQANATRVAVSANNIANMRTTGRADAPETAYQPQEVSAVAQEGGGVEVNVRGTDPATTTAYAPTDANADAEGQVAMPNVSLEKEMVDNMMAVTGYKANATVIRSLAAMDKSLLDITA